MPYTSAFISVYNISIAIQFFLNLISGTYTIILQCSLSPEQIFPNWSYEWGKEQLEGHLGTTNNATI